MLCGILHYLLAFDEFWQLFLIIFHAAWHLFWLFSHYTWSIKNHFGHSYPLLIFCFFNILLRYYWALDDLWSNHLRKLVDFLFVPYHFVYHLVYSIFEQVSSCLLCFKTKKKSVVFLNISKFAEQIVEKVSHPNQEKLKILLLALLKAASGRAKMNIFLLPPSRWDFI